MLNYLASPEGGGGGMFRLDNGFWLPLLLLLMDYFIPTRYMLFDRAADGKHPLLW